SRIASLPTVKCLRRHPHLPADFAHLLSALGLPQGVNDLLLAVPLPRHPSSSFRFRPEDHIQPPFSTFHLSRFRGLGQSSASESGGGASDTSDWLRASTARRTVPTPTPSLSATWRQERPWARSSPTWSRRNIARGRPMVFVGGVWKALLSL